jgi:Mce-associated membrane protein
MAKPPVRTRTGPGASRNRAVAAAARAATKRAERARAEESDEPPAATAEAEAPRAEPSPEPSAEPSPEPSPKARQAEETGERAAARERRGHGVRVAVLTALAVVGLVSAAAFGWLQQSGEGTREARAQALAAARKAAPDILSYRYQHLGRDFAKARTHLTGGFRKEYAKTTEKVVGPTAKKYKGEVTATIARPRSGGTPAASVVSASRDRVVVLLFMNQITKNTQAKSPRVDLNRVRMTMVPTAEGWKVSAVDAL